MSPPGSRVAVSGASGYLGSRICAGLESRGWQVVKLIRQRDRRDPLARHFDLREPVDAATLSSVDVLIHAAYDLSARRPADIWRINVDGTRRLLIAAREAKIPRIIVLSSMSAFDGTTQIYGRAKLDIEKLTREYGGHAIRPGLVYGPQPGGMMGALRKVARLPIIPLPSGDAQQHPVHEDDLVSVIAALAAMESPPLGPIGVAQAKPVAFRDLLVSLCAQEGRRCRFITVPWRLVYRALQVAELAHLPVAFRADSLLGLLRTAPTVENGHLVAEFGVTVRDFRP